MAVAERACKSCQFFVTVSGWIQKITACELLVKSYWIYYGCYKYNSGSWLTAPANCRIPGFDAPLMPAKLMGEKNAKMVVL